MRDVVIVEAVRAPIGKRNGLLSTLRPVHLAARLLRALLDRAQIDPALIEDVILGCVTPLGEQGANLARLAVLQAGLPVDVPAVTLNRMCGSGQQAVHFAAQAIAAGDMDVVIAGGIEVMSRVPLAADWPAEWPPDFPYPLVHQGLSAEMIAEQWGLTREQLDRYAFESHLKAAAATKRGDFVKELIPIEVAQPDGTTRCLEYDEGIRFEPNLEKMGQLPPAFKPDGVITAGNASQISDGCAVLLLMSLERAIGLGLKPRARFAARSVVGSDPVSMLTGPIPATRRVLNRSGLTIDQIAAIEINEAFAAVVLAWEKEIVPDPARVNFNGGAIAHGHPLGATGAVLMTKLLYQLERTGGHYGLQTMCIGHGMATATILERL
ncbi:acetyl-CoA acyltransferase [Thermoflexales bacterium]|nr:acetyl-CoA acyltransferase [Thermoflexales bacterium]